MGNNTGQFGRPDSQINSVASSDYLSAVVCGRFVEVTLYPERIPSGQAEPPRGGGEGKEKESEESIKKRSAARARRTVRRLCNANGLFFMHTLTFAVSHIQYFQGEKPFVLVPVEETKERDKVIVYWKEFARKLRRQLRGKGEEFRYIAVIERHTGKRASDVTIKKDTFHIHFVTDRLIHKRKLQKMWKHGLCNHSDWTKGRKKTDLAENDTLPPPDNPGAYLSKYIGKDAEETESFRKSYWASRNLDKPLKLWGKDAGLSCLGGKEIYKNARIFTDKETGNTYQQVSITYSMPVDVQSHLVQRKPTNNREKVFRRNAKRIRATDLLAKLRSEKNGKDIHRNTGLPVIEEIIEGKRASIEEARRRYQYIKVFDERAFSPTPERIARRASKKRKILRRITGPQRFDMLAKKRRKDTVFKSHNLRPCILHTEVQ